MSRSTIVVLVFVACLVPATTRAQSAVPAGRPLSVVSLSDLALSLDLDEGVVAESVASAAVPNEETTDARSRELLRSRRVKRAGWLGLVMTGAAFVMHPMMSCAGGDSYDAGGSCGDVPGHAAAARALIGINTAALVGTLGMGAWGSVRTNHLRREGLTFPASSGPRRLAMTMGWLAYIAGLLVLPFASGIVLMDSISD